jgi:thymidylate synthase (FAD)
MDCLATSFGARICLVAVHRPLIGDGDPRRLPVLAVKTSVGKASEKGIQHYLTAEWKEGWGSWLRQAKEAFPSVLEHAVFTFFIDGISRVASHQLVRHRLVSFTQESQRYTEVRILKALEAEALDDAIKNLQVISWKRASEKLFVVPPEVDKEKLLRRVWLSVGEYLDCRVSGSSMEDCRYLLPQAVRTSLLATANLREWMHIIRLRTDSRAQWEIREVAEKVKEVLKHTVPEVL